MLPLAPDRLYNGDGEIGGHACVRFCTRPDARKEQDVGMLLYLLLSAGFFILMMRFGCGAHVMGHEQHSGHGAEAHRYEEGPSRSTGAPSDFAPKPAEHTHG